jgi:hypothetical protein
MRATKITKYFKCENKDPLNFFPTKEKREDRRIYLDTNTNTNTNTKNNSLDRTIPSSSFDTVNVQLETKYYTCGSVIEYSVFFNNNSQLDIKGSINNVDTPLNGDLMALHEALKYIVYHPNMSQKLNRYKFNIYTNSKNICGIFKPDYNILGSNIYFKIQSLLKCIKNISIEYWNC